MSYFDDFENDYMSNLKSREESISRGETFRKKEKPKRPKFTRGYETCRKRIAKNPYYSRSCFNCEYFYQAVGDKQECCQNTNVLEFDMIVKDNTVYCVHWKQNCRNNGNSLFKKTGRSILD